jgi:hypothetical protein
MTNDATIPRAIRYTLFGKVSTTETEMDSLVIVEVNWVKNMRQALFQEISPLASVHENFLQG